MPPSTESIAPLSDAILVAVSKLVDDAQSDIGYREPSHSEIQTQIDRFGLAHCDPNQNGQTLGKAKRVRAVLGWAIENDHSAGGALISGLTGHIRGCGGFRQGSPNYVGEHVIQTAIDAFASEGFDLTEDGELRAQILDNLSGAQLTEALHSYVRRAKKGIEDAALITGTSKDLLEATAAHVLTRKLGTNPEQKNFPTLLGQAFVALGLSVTDDGKPDTPINRLDRGLFEAACAINTLRNKEGTGHGRPWVTSLKDHEARTAIETMGIVAERMLNALQE